MCIRDRIDTSYETSHSGNAASKYLFASIAGRYTTINIKHCMKELNNSIFILIGDKTEEKEESARLYQEILPSIEIEYIKDSKELPQMECPDQFIEAIHTLLL